MEIRDNLHFNCREIDGYNLPFNFIISEREAGKSTAIWLDKAYKYWKQDRSTTLVIRRKIVHITKSYIDDIAEIINKFTDDKVVFEYSQSSFKDGIVDIKIKGVRFLRIVGLSSDITTLKSLMLRGLKFIVFDEFICNPEFDEKYLKNEAFKFMECFNTFQREAKNLKCYFMGNPYSLYNPYFIFFNVDTSKLQRGVILSDKTSYVIQCYEIKPELRAQILKKNPLYKFDNDYTKYAFNGVAINDSKIRILSEKPMNYFLYACFKAEGKYIGIYRSNDYAPSQEKHYFAMFINPNELSLKRDIYAFDFAELVERTCLLSNEDRGKFSKIKGAIQRREIEFQSIEVYYIMEEIYYNL